MRAVYFERPGWPIATVSLFVGVTCKRTCCAVATRVKYLVREWSDW